MITQTTIGTIHGFRVDDFGVMATVGRVNMMIPNGTKASPYDLVRAKWWVDNDGVTIAQSIEVLDQEMVIEALERREVECG